MGETGITTEPTNYKNYADLTKASGFGEFQCMLFHKSTNAIETGGAEGHDCVRPCTAQTLKLNLGENRKICEAAHNDCNWEQWNSWSTCTPSADTPAKGTRTRTRKMNAFCEGDKKPAMDEWA